MEKSKGNWDFDAASSPQSNDALERLCIRGRPLLCAEAGGACERFLPKLAARACCSLNLTPATPLSQLPRSVTRARARRPRAAPQARTSAQANGRPNSLRRAAGLGGTGAGARPDDQRSQAAPPPRAGALIHRAQAQSRSLAPVCHRSLPPVVVSIRTSVKRQAVVVGRAAAAMGGGRASDADMPVVRRAGRVQQATMPSSELIEY